MIVEIIRNCRVKSKCREIAQINIPDGSKGTSESYSEDGCLTRRPVSLKTLVVSTVNMPWDDGSQPGAEFGRSGLSAASPFNEGAVCSSSADSTIRLETLVGSKCREVIQVNVRCPEAEAGRRESLRKSSSPSNEGAARTANCVRKDTTSNGMMNIWMGSGVEDQLENPVDFDVILYLGLERFRSDNHKYRYPLFASK